MEVSSQGEKENARVTSDDSGRLGQSTTSSAVLTATSVAALSSLIALLIPIAAALISLLRPPIRLLALLV
jgi:hypothetical protein